MRVITGSLRGRNFDSPRGHRTHPMSDKIRGALFNVLGDVAELTVLDAFAGSGAIAIEAVSRGALHALAVESDKTAQKTISNNILSLEIEDRMKLTRANASVWSDNNTSQLFDIVVCDPPYDELQLSLIAKLTRHLTEDGVYVLSWPGSYEVPDLPTMEVVSHKTYGDAQLIFYKRV
ncbi:MAG: putative Methyltransferase [Candidatus Saccharibacteria bacterium]|nr:putative Methyltransferase [Candidatus Saccharibacteria bacterium]